MESSVGMQDDARHPAVLVTGRQELEAAAAAELPVELEASKALDRKAVATLLVQHLSK